MPSASALLRRLNWIARRALARPAQSPREELWRLNGLRRIPAGIPGCTQWQGRPLYYADAPAVHGQLNEIFIQGVYDFTSANRTPRIIDCGAHVGVGILRWRELFPEADITAFEADPTIAGRLKQNLAARGDTRTQVHAAAAWVQDGTVSFQRTGADNGHISESADQGVPARDLAAFCAQPVDLLKLDIEGAEERVLNHLDERGALRNVRSLVCEWHQWTPESPALHAALARLVAAGFVYRISAAGCLGDRMSPVFTKLAWPGNHLLFYAWKPATPKSA